MSQQDYIGLGTLLLLFGAAIAIMGWVIPRTKDEQFLDLVFWRGKSWRDTTKEELFRIGRILLIIGGVIFTLALILLFLGNR